MNYYKLALSQPVEAEGSAFDANAGSAMVWKGIARGRDRATLYKAGIVGAPVEVVVGATELFKKGLTNTVVEFLVDVAHIMLMLGGLYLLWSSFAR